MNEIQMRALRFGMTLAAAAAASSSQTSSASSVHSSSHAPFFPSLPGIYFLIHVGFY